MMGEKHEVAVDFRAGGSWKRQTVGAARLDGFCHEAIELAAADAWDMPGDGCSERRSHADFAMGFVAALDALASGAVDFSDPWRTIGDAIADYEDIAGREPKVSDVLARHEWDPS